MSVLLGVNIDHVATVRQARGTDYPSVIEAAELAESAGADSITVHLREDRRHIQDEDVRMLCVNTRTRINLEMAVTDEMMEIALLRKPADVCLVPEKRAELTTEGGLDVLAHFDAVQYACKHLGSAGIRVSLFIDPDVSQLEAALGCGAPVVELHTGSYADADKEGVESEYRRIVSAAEFGDSIGLQVNAGHGLHYENVQAIVRIPQLVELNIGHSIVARALFSGLEKAVKDMLELMN